MKNKDINIWCKFKQRVLLWNKAGVRFSFVWELNKSSRHKLRSTEQISDQNWQAAKHCRILIKVKSPKSNSSQGPAVQRSVEFEGFNIDWPRYLFSRRPSQKQLGARLNPPNVKLTYRPPIWRIVKQEGSSDNSLEDQMIFCVLLKHHRRGIVALTQVALG